MAAISMLSSVAAFTPCATQLQRPLAALSWAYRPELLARATGMKEKGLGETLGDALGGAARTALEKLQDAASEAAMQEENPFLAERTPPQPMDTYGARELPDSFENAVELAVEAVNEALLDGSSRMVVEFDTSAGDETYNLLSRTLKMVEPFMPLFARSQDLRQLGGNVEDEAVPDGEVAPRWQLLFPDEGTAAFVRQKWDLPPGTVCGSMPRAKFVPGVDALLIVAPAATEVPGVQRLLDEVEESAGATPVVLFNPKLVDMQSTGYGLVGRELRNMVADNFELCFCLKSQAEGAVFRVYPDAYTVWREEETAPGGYELLYRGMTRPSGDEVDDLIYADTDDAEAAGQGFMAGFSKFVKGFQAM